MCQRVLIPPTSTHQIKVFIRCAVNWRRTMRSLSENTDPTNFISQDFQRAVDWTRTMSVREYWSHLFQLIKSWFSSSVQGNWMRTMRYMRRILIPLRVFSVQWNWMRTMRYASENTDPTDLGFSACSGTEWEQWDTRQRILIPPT